MPSDYEFSASLDASQVESEIAKMQKQMVQMANEANAAFNKADQSLDKAASNIDRSSMQTGQLRGQFQQLGGVLQQIGGSSAIGTLGVQIGLVSGGVSALVTKFIELSAQAVQTFQQITQEAIQLNQEAQSAQRLFSNLFGGGDEGLKKAEAFSVKLRELATRLGIDSAAANQFAQSIAPDSETVGQLFEVITLADRFADLNNKQFADVRFSFDEMVAGDFTSARDILNLSKESVKQIKEMQKEYGAVDGVVRGLTQYLEDRKLGVDSAELMAGTAERAQKSMQGLRTEFVMAFGQSPFEEFNEGLNIMTEFLNKNRDHLLRISYALGDILGAVMDLFNTFRSVSLDNLDVAAVADTADDIALKVTEITSQLGLMVENGRQFFEAIAPLVGVTGGVGEKLRDWLDPVHITANKLDEVGQKLEKAGGNAGMLGKGMQNLSEAISGPAGILGIFSKAGEALQTLNQILALSAAGWKGIFAGIQPTVDMIVNSVKSLGAAAEAVLTGDLTKMAEARELWAKGQEAMKNGLFDEVAAREAAEQSMLKSMEAFEKAQQKVDDLGKKREERGVEVGDEILEEALGGAQNKDKKDDELLKAEEKLGKEMEKLRTTHMRNLEKITIDHGRRITEAEIDNQEKRLDLARQHDEKIEDIHRKHNQSIEEAERDLNQKEQDLARKQGQERTDLEREINAERAEIERNYQQQLADIRRQFEMDAQDAEEAQDAIAFVNAVKRREKAVEEAKIERNRTVEEAAIQAEQKRMALKEKHQLEIEDAQIAHQQKLEDLRLRLEQELEQENIRHQRALEQQAIAEQRKTEELQRQVQQRLEDEARADAQRLEDLNTRLAKEIELVKKAEEAKVEAKAEAARQMVEVEQQALAASGPMGDMGTSANFGRGRSRPGSGVDTAGLRNRFNLSRGQAEMASRFAERSPLARFALSKLANRRFATGGSMVVPPGYNNDDYLIGVSSGEGVAVTPKHMMFSPPSPQPVVNQTSHYSPSATVNVDPGVLSDAQEFQVRQVVYDILDKLS